MKSSTKPWIVSIVALVALSSLLGCGETPTSNTTDLSVVESAAETGSTLGVVSSASGLTEGPGRRGPSDASLAACANTGAGESCSFTDPRGGSHSGTCTATRDDPSQLACRPDERRGPPEAALAACVGAQAGAECSFEARSRTVSGACRTPRNGDALVCFPTDWPMR